MMNLNSKYGDVVIYAKTVEQAALSQIITMANSPLGENAHIRIMPDCHAGAGCVIGTTMKITDKVCPNLVGVDIGCGVDLVKTDIDFSSCFDKLDLVIRNHIPHGQKGHQEMQDYDFSSLLCWNALNDDIKFRAQRALGTLGGGNHFVEAYSNGYLAVHSGSRNIGLETAQYYQNIATQNIPEDLKIDTDLAFLTGGAMDAYLHDVAILQKFAVANRQRMLEIIVNKLGGHINDIITSTHNYIDTDAMILRKGAISAEAEQKLVIPLNMRDGMLVCIGKGNPEWNFSAPHGAGRLYSRSEAKEAFTVEEYQEAMKGIYSTCINRKTLDEAPFVYKDYKEIMDCVKPTVDIVERLIPIYNFKAN